MPSYETSCYLNYLAPADCDPCAGAIRMEGAEALERFSASGGVSTNRLKPESAANNVKGMESR